VRAGNIARIVISDAVWLRRLGDHGRDSTGFNALSIVPQARVEHACRAWVRRDDAQYNLPVARPTA